MTTVLSPDWLVLFS